MTCQANFTYKVQCIAVEISKTSGPHAQFVIYLKQPIKEEMLWWTKAQFICFKFHCKVDLKQAQIRQMQDSKLLQKYNKNK